MKLTWKRNLFLNKTQFFDQNNQVGKINSTKLWQSARIEFLNRKYEVQSFKAFVHRGEIYALDPRKMQLRFKYNAFTRSGIIKFEEKEYKFFATNILGTKWKLTENNKTIIKLSNSFFKGELESTTDNPAILFASYYMMIQKNIYSYILAISYLVYLSYQLL